MLFLYPPSPQSRIADILFWVQIIIVAVVAFFLLVEYLNTKQITHLLWAFAFIGIFILFHQVANNASFGVFDESVTAGLSVFIPGAIASGLLFSIYGKEKRFLRKFSYGSFYLIVVIIFTVLITVLSLINVRIALIPGVVQYEPDYDYLVRDWLWFPMLFLMGINAVSGIIIIGLPIYTTVKTKVTSPSAYLISIGGILMATAGILLAISYTGGQISYYPEMGVVDVLPKPNFITHRNHYTGIAQTMIAAPLIVYLIVAASFFYVFGMLYENKWSFNIPGVEFEETKRVDISLPGGKKRIGALVIFIGSIVLVIGCIIIYPILANSPNLAGYLRPFDDDNPGEPFDTIGGSLAVSGILGLVFPFLLGIVGILSVLSKWKFSKYIPTIVGVLFYLCMISLMLVWYDVFDAVFDDAESWEVSQFVKVDTFPWLIFSGLILSCVITAGGVAHLVIKE